MQGTVWMLVPDYPEYAVSYDGQVMRLVDRHTFKSGTLVNPNSRGNKNYRYTYLNGKRHRTHRLVAKAFIPNPENKPDVHHIDDDASHNTADNLMWVTPLEHIAIHSV